MCVNSLYHFSHRVTTIKSVISEFTLIKGTISITRIVSSLKAFNMSGGQYLDKVYLNEHGP